MSSLSKGMKVLFLASTVAATNASADDKICPDQVDPGLFDTSKPSICLDKKFEELSHVYGEHENYRVSDVNEVSIYSNINGHHIGTIDLHWDTLQPEVSEADIPFSDLTQKSQGNFNKAVKEACNGIRENLKTDAQPLLDRAQEYYGERGTAVQELQGTVNTLVHFTNEYCND